MDAMILLDQLNIFVIVKFLLGVLMSVYAVFALLMMRQISAMTRAVTMQDDYIIRMLGALHFGFSVLVLVIVVLAGTT